VEIRKNLAMRKNISDMKCYFSHENNGIPIARSLFSEVNSLKTSKVLCKSTKGTALLPFASHEDQH
jgi:hypothetical protein